MTDDYETPGPETQPGDLGTEEFLDIFETMQQVQTETDDWEFDRDQKAAIRHDRGPLHLTAGPGSGKTTVTTASVLKWLLVDGVPPSGIIVTTFTEKAADNLEQRLETCLAALGYADVVTTSELHIGTSHQLWADILREFRYKNYQNVELLDGDSQAMFILQHSEYVDVLADGDAGHFANLVPADVEDDGSTTISAAARTATRLFNRLSQFQVDVDALASTAESELQRLAEAYQTYCETLREESRCDFARLQERFLSFLDTKAGQRFMTGDPDRGQPPLQRIAVDEYQDANPLQQAIYFRLAAGMPTDTPTLMVVGDDDQALYRFRGGTVDCLIEFPQRLADFLGICEDKVATQQLRWNYRSRPEIVQWVNRHIGDNPTMEAPDARAPGKAPMEPARGSSPHPSVHLLNERNKQTAAAAFAEEVERLHDTGYIEDYSQVALLAHSTREEWEQYDSQTFVGACVDALEDRGIPVHNPRNKAFLQQEEVQAMLAALAACLDPEYQYAEDNVFPYGATGETIEGWQHTLTNVIDNYDADGLADYIEATGTNVAASSPGDVADVSVIDVYNRLRSLEPFATWTSDDGDLARTERLGKLSQLLEAFEGIAEGITENRQLVRTSHDKYDTVSVRFLSDFYWTFCRYLQSTGLDDPEDPFNTQPLNHVQVMTFHQAKGLEFPVVFTASLDRRPAQVTETDDAGDPLPTFADKVAPYTHRTPPTDALSRAERDQIRQFYVAHSRAQEHLVLLGTDYYLRPADGETVVPSLGADAGVPLTEQWFDSTQRLDQGAQLAPTDKTVGPPDPDNTRRTYSIVADVLSFRRCQRQYGYHTEHEFAAGSGTQLFAGLAVHQTLDWAHRYCHGDLDGVPTGSVPDTEELRAEFDSVVEDLRAQRIMPMGRAAVDSVFEHVKRFNEHVGPDLYPQIVDTECKLRRNEGNFLLTGVADVIADDDGHTTLCDYKATSRPEPDDGYLTDYREQLLVYAGLYKEDEGEYPDSAVLYFLAEDDPEATKLEVDFDPAGVADAMTRFKQTVRDLEHTRETNNWSEMDPSDLPDEDTCDECDFRWDCPDRDYSDR